jgi:hypothetical protein
VTEHWFLAEQTHGALSKNETAHQQEIKRLKESMSIAMGALDYYASEENWYPVNKIWEHKMVIGSTDTEGENWVGGRRAREALAQLEKVLNEGETK